MIQSKKVVKECEGERVESESVAVAVKVEHSLNITLKDETHILKCFRCEIVSSLYSVHRILEDAPSEVACRRLLGLGR